MKWCDQKIESKPKGPGGGHPILPGDIYATASSYTGWGGSGIGSYAAPLICIYVTWPISIPPMQAHSFLIFQKIGLCVRAHLEKRCFLEHLTSPTIKKHHLGPPPSAYVGCLSFLPKKKTTLILDSNFYTFHFIRKSGVSCRTLR